MGRAGAKSKASAEARPQSAFVGGPDASWRDDAPAGAAGADRSFGGESPVRQVRSPTVSIRSKGGALLSPPGWVGGEDDDRGSERNFREFMINQRAAAVYKDKLHQVVPGLASGVTGHGSGLGFMGVWMGFRVRVEGCPG